MKPAFTFSIRTALKEAWALFTKHIQFFIGIALVSVVLNFAGNGKHTPVIVSIILGVLSFLWGMIWLKISLSVARGDESRLSFGALHTYMPTGAEVLGYIGVMILAGLLILCGLVMLIIPGIYIMIRLSVAGLAYLDRKDGVKKSLRYSWSITKSNIWIVLLVGGTTLALYIVGAITLGVGLLITYPLATILMAKLYLALTAHYDSTHDAVAETPTPHVPQETDAPIAS